MHVAKTHESEHPAHVLVVQLLVYAKQLVAFEHFVHTQADVAPSKRQRGLPRSRHAGSNQSRARSRHAGIQSIISLCSDIPQRHSGPRYESSAKRSGLSALFVLGAPSQYPVPWSLVRRAKSVLDLPPRPPFYTQIESIRALDLVYVGFRNRIRSRVSHLEDCGHITLNVSNRALLRQDNRAIFLLVVVAAPHRPKGAVEHLLVYAVNVQCMRKLWQIARDHRQDQEVVNTP